MTGAHAEPWAGDRLVLEVVNVGGQAGEIELKFRRDTVEICRREHCCGVLDRDELREWLIRPAGVLVVDEIRLTAAADGHVVLSLTGAASRTLAPAALAYLRQRV